MCLKKMFKKILRNFLKSLAAKKKGITLLLVVAILSSLMSISMGIFNIIFGQIRISGEIADSFLAFYAADQGIERILYLDRVTHVNDTYGICTGAGIPCYQEFNVPAISNGCYDITVNKTSVPVTTEIKVLGQYTGKPGCSIANRVVKRGFNLTY